MTPGVAIRHGLLAALALLLAACGAHPTREPPSGPGRDSGPTTAIDVSRIPEPIPRPEPLSAYGNRSPYTVLGRNYTVLASAKGYVERGFASWYGNKFHGRPTSSREPYDMYRFTAAHKSLPLPSFVRVTNLDNGQSVVVRVNDRGPFHDNRIIDLSYAAAVRIGIAGRGTGLVEVRAIDPADSGPDRSSLRPVIGPHRIYVQVGAFDDRDNAQRIERRLDEQGIKQTFLDRVRKGGKVLHRVRIGPLADTAALDALTTRLQALGLDSFTVAVD